MLYENKNKTQRIIAYFLNLGSKVFTSHPIRKILFVYVGRLSESKLSTSLFSTKSKYLVNEANQMSHKC